MKKLTVLFVRDKQFYRTIAAIGVPIVMQSLITTGLNFVDTMMVGTLGQVQISACSLAGSFVNIFQILCMGLGGGAAVTTSWCWGAGRFDELKKTITIMLRITLSISMLFFFCVAFFPRWIMDLYTPDGDVIGEGARYFRYCAAAFPFIGFSATMTIVLRSVKAVKIPLISSIAAFLMNIFFNWVFIFGNLGAPRLEIAGAALGTLLARLAECAVIGGYVFLVDKRICYKIRDLFCDAKSQFHVYLKYSLPVAFSDLLLAIGNNVVAIIMGHIGTAFVAANAVVMQIAGIAAIFQTASSSAASIMTGNTLGQGNAEKAYRDGVTFLSIGCVIGLISAGVILLLCPLFLSVFHLPAETLTIANELMYAVAFMQTFDYLQSIITKGVLRGGGDTRFLLIADTIFLWAVSIPFGYAAGILWKLPTFWIFVSLRGDRLLKVIWCVQRLHSRKWIKMDR